MVHGGCVRRYIAASRPRVMAVAALVPLALVPVVGLVATSPAIAAAQGDRSQGQVASSTGSSFIVTGKIPYTPDSSSDVTTPANTSCSTLKRLEVLVEAKLAEHTVFPSDAAEFVRSTGWTAGTRVSLGPTTGVARELLTYPGFINMNNEVQVYR